MSNLFYKRLYFRILSKLFFCFLNYFDNFTIPLIITFIAIDNKEDISKYLIFFDEGLIPFMEYIKNPVKN